MDQLLHAGHHLLHVPRQRLVLLPQRGRAFISRGSQHTNERPSAASCCSFACPSAASRCICCRHSGPGCAGAAGSVSMQRLWGRARVSGGLWRVWQVHRALPETLMSALEGRPGTPAKGRVPGPAPTLLTTAILLCHPPAGGSQGRGNSSPLTLGAGCLGLGLLTRTATGNLATMTGTRWMSAAAGV